MIYLKDVTLVVVDSMSHALTAMAIHECTKHAIFRAINIHTNAPELIPVSEAHYYEAPLFPTKDDVMWYLWQEVPKPLRTSHFLFIQWDSWITNPARWRPEYLEYDYIGAPWPFHEDEHQVGNGGFSLRSARLARHVASTMGRETLVSSEDHMLCRYYRTQLEAEGFRWAPIELAREFSYECEAPHDTFGYHAMFNWPYVLTREQIDERLRIAPAYVREQHFGYVQLQAKMNGG
jgi:hypothetical protein